MRGPFRRNPFSRRSNAPEPDQEETRPTVVLPTAPPVEGSEPPRHEDGATDEPVADDVADEPIAAQATAEPPEPAAEQPEPIAQPEPAAAQPAPAPAAPPTPPPLAAPEPVAAAAAEPPPAAEPATTVAEPPTAQLADTPAGAEVPAGADGLPSGPSFRLRGRLRRRLRYLRRVRELGFRDLGGLVFDLHRFSRRADDLVLGKLNALAAVDRELRALERVLNDERDIIELREPGIGACFRCGALHGSEARFCPSCGVAFSGPRAFAEVGEHTVSAVGQIGSLSPAPGASAEAPATTPSEAPTSVQERVAAAVGPEPAAAVPTQPVAAQAPAVEEPVAAQAPAVEEPAVEEPDAGEPAVEEPPADEPAVEEPAVEEPEVQAPAVAEPAVDEPAVDEAPADEPAERWKLPDVTSGDPLARRSERKK